MLFVFHLLHLTSKEKKSWDGAITLRHDLAPGSGGGGGVLPEKVAEVCGPVPKTLTLFITKIWATPYRIYDLNPFYNLQCNP